MDRLSALERDLCQEFAARVRTRFPGRPVDLRLFGSRARRDARPDSDMDVLVLIPGMTFKERNLVSDIATDLMLEEEVPFEIAPRAMPLESFHQLQSRERLLALEIERDGIPL